jgi:hypothetical protein
MVMKELRLEPLWADQCVNEIGQQAERDNGAEDKV